jgi:hypothetical protein
MLDSDNFDSVFGSVFVKGFDAYLLTLNKYADPVIRNRSSPRFQPDAFFDDFDVSKGCSEEGVAF